jgi:hypothetical protein
MRRSPSSRRVLAVLLLGAALGLSGCSFLEDEFGWLDRAGPAPLADRGQPTLERP